jgi:hypothetical protein
MGLVDSRRGCVIVCDASSIASLYHRGKVGTPEMEVVREWGS